MARLDFSTSDDVFDYLMRYVNVEKGQKTEFKLDRMQFLAEQLGNPHLGRLTIHIAGSKGKGSVSSMCASALEEAGFRTGLYTSPHFIRWKERISFPNKELEENTLISAAKEVLALVDGKPAEFFPGSELPTYFELTTLIGFCAFRRAGCTAQVIETGLGGRLDSTNIVIPDVAIITTIELEHTQFLGTTLAAIAGEKAGIIKEDKPCCIGFQKPEAESQVLQVFRMTAKQRNSPLFEARDLIRIDNIQVAEAGTSCRMFGMIPAKPQLPRSLPPQLEKLLQDGLELSSPMVGEIQAQNMALSLTALAIAVPGISKAAVARGFSKARLPARFEIISSKPPIVFDGAHTPDSIQLTVKTLNQLFPAKPAVLIFACAIDKKHEEMAEILAGSEPGKERFQEIIVTKPGDFKQSDPERIFQSFAKYSKNVMLIADTESAVIAGLKKSLQNDAVLLIAGSFYLCSEAAKILWRNVIA